MQPEVTLFVGPSAWGLATQRWPTRTLDRRPPVLRGDVDALVAARSPGVLVLCDGVFQSAPAVGHAEIGRAVEAGWQVWGVSSLGAIRAYEMRHHGVRGFGWVYAQFARYTDFRDDELCLLHLPDPPYLPLTEALVNLRYALEQRGATCGITPGAASAVVRVLRGLWFGDRTPERISTVLRESAGIDAAAARRLLHWMDRHRIKAIDLDTLMRAQPWLATAPSQSGR